MEFTPEQIKRFQEIVKDPVVWAQMFIKLPGEKDYFQPNYVQKKILKTDTRKCVICVHRRAGKSICSTDYIYLDNGSKVQVKELDNKKFRLLTLVDEDIKSVDAWAHDNRQEYVYKLTTETMKECSRNYEHPFYVSEITSVKQGRPIVDVKGWKPLGEIKVGDYIAVPTTLPFELETQDISDEELKFLAYMIGDGHCKAKALQFIQQSGLPAGDIILSDFFDVCKKLNIKIHNKNGKHWRLLGGQQGIAATILQKHNILDCLSADKKIPEIVYKLSLSQLQLFLSRLYGTDGWAYARPLDKHGSSEIGYCSISKDLCLSIQHLLLRFGINSSVRHRDNVNAYCVDIHDSIDQQNFIEKIGIFGKEYACNQLHLQAKSINEGRIGQKALSITHEKGRIYKHYEDVGKNRNGSPRVLRRKIDITPWRIKDAPSHMRWEKVTSIEKSDTEKEIISIVVPEHGTYLTDFYEHNTYGLIIKALYNMFTRSRCQVLLIAPGEKQLLRFFMEFDDILSANPELAKDVIESQKKAPFRKLTNGSWIAGFIAKNGSDSLRGQSGDLILIDEADYIPQIEWKVIDPIIRGDQYRKPPEMYAASTPNVNPKSVFLRMLNQDNQGDSEEDSDKYGDRFTRDVTPIFVPITENPDWSPEKVEEIRQDYLPDRLTAYEQEYLCLPVSANERQVFKKFQIQKAAILEAQVSASAPPEVKRAVREGYSYNPAYIPSKQEGEIRCIGVDWDRVQAGPALLVLSYIPGLQQMHVIYREEVSKDSEYVFDAANHRIIFLHKYLKFDHAFLEATRDVAQCHQLQLLAKKEAPDLFPNIELIDYNTNHISLDVRTHVQTKSRIKGVIVNNLQNVFEDGRIAFPEDDITLNHQLTNYTIVGYTERGARYSSTNEHFVDALGLACWAIFKHYKNPFYAAPATRVISVARKENEDYIEKTSRTVLNSALGSNSKKFRRGAWGNDSLRSKI